MTKKLEINFTKKPEIVFQFDQFLNVEQAVDKFLNKKENLKKLIAPLIPTNLEETIQKLIPEVSDGYTPQKGVDYDDGKDGETPSDEKIISLIEPRIQKAKDGTTPKKGIDYFTKQELNEIKKELKTTILSEMPEHATKEEVNIKITEVLDKIRKLPTWGGGAQFLRQLMDVNVWNPTAQQYGLTYNPSRGEFALTAITGGGGGAVDSVNWQTWVVVLDADDIDETASRIWFTTAEETKLAGIETWAEVNTIDTVSDTSEIDLTITARALSASIVAWSIDETKLDTSVNASLDLADTALQSSAIGVSVQAYSSVLQNTTASFTTTDETKLDNITVTQAVNLDTMESDIAALANGMVYKGNWDASAGTFPWAGSAQTGWFYTVSVGGTVDSVVFNVDDRLVATTDNASTTVYAGNWTKLDATDAVTSIFSRTGNVVSANGDYTASQITNVPAGNIAATDVQTALNELDTDKQATLVSGTNIKTVNSTTLLGSGDIAVATTAQGALADSALQPWDIASGTITARADDINFSGGSDGDVLTVQADGSLALEAPASGGANTALSNLSGVAINTSLVSDTDNTDDLGTTLKKWANLFVTTIGATGTRITKLWATDIESTNIPTVGGTAILSSLTAPSFTTVELGAGWATDTTLSRVSAWVVAVEGKTLANLTDGGTFAADISVPDEAYGSGWNGSVEVPTKNAIYDKIETMWWLWSELGTTTLGSAASSISVSIAAKKHLRIVIRVIAKANSTATYLRFNSDSGANYSLRRTRSGSAGGSWAVNEMSLWGSTTGNDEYYTLDVVNQSAYSKFLTGTGVEWNQDASAILVTITDAGVWNNTSAQITTVSIHTSTGNADFGIGSFVTVEWHD